MPNRRTRDRQLAKLAARRAAERRKKRRQRLLAASVALLVALGGISYGLVVLFKGTSKKAAASATASPSASASPSPSASASASAAAAVACGAKKPKDAGQKKPSFSAPPKTTIDATRTYRATFVTSCGTFDVDLDPKTAPNTVNSLVFLIKHRFFDGLTFHRIARDFVIQGGDPQGNGSGGPGYSTVDKPPANAQYPPGTVAMAKTGSDPAGTAGSQFFVVTSSQAESALAPNGVGQYAIVGHVVSGMDVVTKIGALPITGGQTDGAPAQTVYIDSITVKEV